MFHWEPLRGVLTVATKRALLLYRYDDARCDMSGAVRELPVPERVRCIAWCGDALCLGFRREYVMLNIATGAMSEVFPTGRAEAPSALPLPPGELLLTRDALGVVVGPDGKTTRRGGLPWSEPPLALASAPPFAVALTPRGVEVRSAAKGASGNAASVGGGSAAAHAAPPAQALLLPDAGWHALIAAPGGWLAAVGADALVAFRPVPLSLQVRALAAAERFDAALQLCDALAALAGADDELPPDGDGATAGADDDDASAAAEAPSAAAAAAAALRADVHARYAHRLFADGAYAEAMSHFAAAKAAPLDVLALFPALLPAEHAAVRAAAAAGRRDALPAGSRLAAAQSALLPFLLPAREAAWRARRAARAPAPPYAARAPVAQQPPPSEDDVRCIDTACVSALVAAGGEPDALLRLLILPNAVDLAVGERVLTEAGRNTELVALLRSHGLHRRALELLSRLGAAAGANATPPPPLSDPTADPTSSPAASPFGPKAVVEYLLALRPQDASLMLEFSVPVLQASPSDGLSLFTRASPPLPPGRVLPHLRQHAPALCAAYLEAEVCSRPAETPHEFHHTLVLLRLDAVSAERAAAGPRWDERFTSPARAKLLASLRDARIRYAPERLLSRLPAGAQLAERAALLRRLRRHGDALALYVHALRDPAAAERYADEVWADAEARADANLASDSAAAAAAAAASEQQPAASAASQQHASMLHAAGSGGFAPLEAPEGEAPERDVYLSLLQVYLRGPGSAAANASGTPDDAALDAALSLLARRASRVDGARALAELPETVPLARVLPFLEGSLRGAGEARRRAAVLVALRRREHFAARDALAARRDRCISLGADATCAVCPGRIGAAVFAVFPDGRVAHYTCYMSATAAAAGARGV